MTARPLIARHRDHVLGAHSWATGEEEEEEEGNRSSSSSDAQSYGEEEEAGLEEARLERVLRTVRFRGASIPRRAVSTGVCVAATISAVFVVGGIQLPGGQGNDFFSFGRGGFNRLLSRAAVLARQWVDPQGREAPASCERCPRGFCDRHAGEKCVWFSEDVSYHCEVESCDDVPVGANLGRCWLFQGRSFYNILDRSAPCQKVPVQAPMKLKVEAIEEVPVPEAPMKLQVKGIGQVPSGERWAEGRETVEDSSTASIPALSPVFPTEDPVTCERCPSGYCDRLATSACFWFEGDLAYHCKMESCSEVPVGPQFSLCWLFQDTAFYSMKGNKEAPCIPRPAPVPVPSSSTSVQTTEPPDLKEEVPALLSFTVSGTVSSTGAAATSSSTSSSTTSSTSVSWSTTSSSSSRTSSSTSSSTTRSSTSTADGRLADAFPEIAYIWLAETEKDQARAEKMKKEVELWVPGGETKIRLVQGVNPSLWPGSGNYKEVERWCSALKPNPYLGATGEKWWQRAQKEVEYAQITASGQPGMPATVMHHVGCTLSHFVTWMDARERKVENLLISESDGMPSWFGTYAGFVEDFQYVTTQLLTIAPPGWDVILLDKCRMGAVGGPVQTFFLPGKMRSQYHVYKWLGRGWAGAALYLVSWSFLEQVPKMIHDNGLFMVDSYLDWRCQEDLQCFSVCAASAPFNSRAFG